MKKIITFFILVLIACTHQKHLPKQALLPDNPERVYKVGYEYFFDITIVKKDKQRGCFNFLKPYWVTTRNGEPYFDGFNNNWSIGSCEDGNVIRQAGFYITRTSVWNKYYTQYGEHPVGSSSRIIQNDTMIWFHPPRDKGFRILELTPFPWVKLPLKVGDKWTDTLKVGSHYGDERWLTWEDNIDVIWNYENKEKVIVNTPLGMLDCYKIISEGVVGQVGKTELTALFNTKYGFVQFYYVNIDGSIIILDLIKVQKQE